jgi:hypothetical protein
MSNKKYKFGPFILHNNVSPTANTWLVTCRGQGVCRGSWEECTVFVVAQCRRLAERRDRFTLIAGGKNNE